MKREDLQVVNEFEASEILEVPVFTLRYWRCKNVRKGPRFMKLENGTVRYPLRWLAQYQEERAIGAEQVIA